MQTPNAPTLDDLPKPPPGWRQRPAGISLCMIVRDEELFLFDALDSVKGIVDEICIADTGSRDRTIEIAKEAGAKVIEIAWEDDFSRARNAAISMASKRWIFVLDADEMLAPKSRDILLALRSRPAHLCGLWIRCFNLANDYKGSGAVSNAIVRVFPNHDRLRYRNAIHEFVALDGNLTGMPAIRSSVEIIHRGYLSHVMRDRKKDERNLALAQAALRKDPEDPFHWYNYASAAVLSRQPATAISALERMRTLNAGRKQGFIPSGLGMLADLYLNEGQNAAKSEEIARETLGHVPTYANAHFTLGKALAAQRRFGEAREAFMAAIEDGKYAHEQFFVDNEVPLWKAHSEIGRTLMEEGAHELAIAWFEFALKQRPKVQAVRQNRARAIEAMGRTDDAIAAFREIWEDDRDDLATVEYLNVLLREGRDQEALDLIDAAVAGVSPESQLILYGSSAAIRSRGGREGAEDAIDHALRIGIEHPVERLRGLFRHYGDLRLVGLLEERSRFRADAGPR